MVAKPRRSPLVFAPSAELKALSSAILFGVATEADFRAANSEDVLAIKSDADVIHYRSVLAPPRRVKAKAEEKDDAPSREFWFVASEESPDRMGDVIAVRGWDLANMKKNPQGLWGHDHDVSVGLITGFEKAVQKDPPQLLEALTCHEEEVAPAGEAAFRLLEAKAIRACSVGFIPKKDGTLRPSSAEQREEWGLGPWGVKYVRQEQIELSICTVPMHPAALQLRGGRSVREERARLEAAVKSLVKKGRLSERSAREFRRSIGALRSFPSAVRVVRSESSDARKALERVEELRAQMTDLVEVCSAAVSKGDSIARAVARVESKLASVASIARSAGEPSRNSDHAALHRVALLRRVAARVKRTNGKGKARR